MPSGTQKAKFYPVPSKVGQTLPSNRRRTNSPHHSSTAPIHQAPPPRVEAQAVDGKTAFDLVVNQFMTNAHDLSAGRDTSYQVIGAIQARQASALEHGFMNVALTPTISVEDYLQNLSVGIQLFAQKYAECGIFELVNKDDFQLSEAHLTYSYYLGEALQGESEFHPNCFRVVGSYLVESGHESDALDLLSQDQNLKALMLALDVMLREIKESYKGDQTAREQRKEARAIEEIQRKLNQAKFIEELIKIGKEIAAVATVLKPGNVAESINKLIELKIANLIKPRPASQNELAAKMVSELIASHKKDHPAEPFHEVFRDMPEALPHLIKAHQKHHSYARKAVNWFLGIFSEKAKIDDVATQMLEPIIHDLVKTPEGENELLAIHAYSPKAYPINDLEGTEKPLRLYQLSRKLITPIVERIIATAKSITFSVPANNNKAAELRAYIAEVARGLDLSSQPAKTAGATALNYAVRLQELSFLIGAGRFARAKELHKELESALAVKLPTLKLISLFLLGRIFIEKRDTFYEREMFRKYNDLDRNRSGEGLVQTPAIISSYSVLKIANNDISTARQIMEIIGNHSGVMETLIAITNEEYLENGELEDARIEAALKYAYCFLAPVFEDEEKETLEQALAHDKDRTLLAAISGVIESKLTDEKWKHLEERIREITIFCEASEVH